MHEHDALDSPHQGAAVRRQLLGACVEVAVRKILTEGVRARHESIELLDLDRPNRRRTSAGASPLDFRPDFLVAEPFERMLHAGPLPLLFQVGEIFDVLEVVIPDYCDRRTRALALL